MITSVEIKKLEREAHAHGLLHEHLMNNAGSACSRVLQDKYDLSRYKIIIFCGTGDNGGDGLSLANHLRSFLPLVILIGDKNKLSDTASALYDQIKSKIPIVTIKTVSELSSITFQKHLHYLFIDALVGLGFSGPLRDPLQHIITYFNSLPGIKISLDIPSGLHPDHTEPPSDHRSPHIHPDLILTYHDIKPALLPLQSKTIVIDIGLPSKAHLARTTLPNPTTSNPPDNTQKN